MFAQVQPGADLTPVNWQYDFRHHQYICADCDGEDDSVAAPSRFGDKEGLVVHLDQVHWYSPRESSSLHPLPVRIEIDLTA